MQDRVNVHDIDIGLFPDDLNEGLKAAIDLINLGLAELRLPGLAFGNARIWITASASNPSSDVRNGLVERKPVPQITESLVTLTSRPLTAGPS